MSAMHGTIDLIEKAIALARALQKRAGELQTAAEVRQQLELDRMLQSPTDKATLMQMTDQSFRSKTASRTVDQFVHILDVQGIPRFFSPVSKALLRGFQQFGGWLPSVSVPLVVDRMQHETANVILPAEREPLKTHLRARIEQGVRMNVNFLGEALLGEHEARRRLENYLEALQLPEIEVLSVKISTLYSQISALAREQTVAILCDRLERLYREADHMRFTRRDLSTVPKFVYLDMEEYRDMRLTAEAFMRTLDRPGLEQASAGIALQAYIPDSFEVQREINAWAKQRVAAGRAPVTIRIVKGANYEMERVEAALRGWPQAPFKNKAETDANFKRMLHEAMSNLDAVRIGVASHNVFDLAYGLVLAANTEGGHHVQFEMLEGMANPQRRALLERTDHLLLYAPACLREDFVNAIGYLIRRLDENTGPENFLRHAFKLEVGDADWTRLEEGFRACFKIDFRSTPRRTQDRNLSLADEPVAEMTFENFVNEPDTDFSLPHNSNWARALVESGNNFDSGQLEGDAVHECLDPSHPGVVIARFPMAGKGDAERAVAIAQADPGGWRAMGLEKRSFLLGRAAQELRRSRGRLIRAAIANGGKTFTEADAEVSEAIDFVEFYRSAARFFYELPEIAATGKGVVLVVSPWNFPIAIPCGGIAAALAAGNTVILKPSSDTLLVAAELCGCFARAGIPPETLQFLPCSVPAYLVSRPGIDAIILTGGTETALAMLKAQPGLPLFAETGGKNATIVTALSDREQAIRNVVHSAFSHSGQKCSATSLLLLEAEVYDDPDFKRALCDAVESLPVGSAWNLQTRVGPLIRPPRGLLEESLKTLELGESWALMPEQIHGNLWSPGIKWNVQPGSVTHLNELFGPVLGVMRFETLEQAIELVNATGFGLTSGLESLDDREQALWRDAIRAGNLYINRSTTGAIVLRQPFGGMGKSAVGPGLKAGGPNYIAQFMRFEEQSEEPPNSHRSSHLLRAIESYEQAWTTEFSREHDHFRLLGEDNIRRYLPMAEIRVRVDPRDSAFEISARIRAAQITGARVLVSVPPGEPFPEKPGLPSMEQVRFIHETDAELAQLIRDARIERIRFAAPGRVPALLRKAAAEAGHYLADAPVLASGRIELLWYLREQSLSHQYHRYGNLGARGTENRLPVD
ncbi:MAG: Aldehyde dehydrogenase [Chthoniobacteraceae bacterium]|nr:Aldehyde dehydrogenase [Chthoniobacteraceae bacterium]